MAEGKQGEEGSAREARKPSPAETHDVERLIVNAPAFLGVRPNTAAGALSSTKKDKLTVDEAKKAVDRYLNGG